MANARSVPGFNRTDMAFGDMSAKQPRPDTLATAVLPRCEDDTISLA